MTLFLDRKKAFEAKFVHDANLDFKTEALRNKFLGEWAANKLEFSGAEAERFARSYATSTISSGSKSCIVAKATADLNGAASIDEIEAKLAEATDQARQQVRDVYL